MWEVAQTGLQTAKQPGEGKQAVAGQMVLYQVSHFQASHTISKQTRGLPQRSAGWEGDVGKGCKPKEFATISQRSRTTNSTPPGSTRQSQPLQLRRCHGQDAPLPGTALLQNCIIFVRNQCPALNSEALYPGEGTSSSRAQLMGLDLPCARQVGFFFLIPSFIWWCVIPTAHLDQLWTLFIAT